MPLIEYLFIVLQIFYKIYSGEYNGNKKGVFGRNKKYILNGKGGDTGKYGSWEGWDIGRGSVLCKGNALCGRY
jgi:hypothetical protein